MRKDKCSHVPSRWSADSNPESYKFCCPQVRGGRPQTIVTAQTTSNLEFYCTERKFNIVVNYHDVLGIDTKPPGSLANGESAFVHKGQGF